MNFTNPYGMHMDCKKVVIGLGIAMVGAYALSQFVYGNRSKRQYEPDIIYGSVVSGCTNDIEQDMLSFLTKCYQEKGDIFTCRMGNNEYTTFIMDNNMMKRAMYNKYADWYKPSGTAKLRFGLDGIINKPNANGAEMLSKALHYAFSNPNNRSKLVKLCEIEAKQLLLKITEKNNNGNQWNYPKIKLNEWIRNIVVKIELNILFGEYFANDNELINLYFNFEPSVPLRLNGKQRIMQNDKINKLLNKINTLCNKYNDNNAPHCIKMANEFCKTNNLSFDQRNRLIIELLWASLSNSIHTMTWMIYHILKEKECYNKILNELELLSTIFDISNSNIINSNESKLKFNELRSLLPVLSSLINEIFRYYGQSNIYRCLLKDIQIKNDLNKIYSLRAGDWIAGSSSFLHRNAKYFNNPNKFIFDRFVDYKNISNKNSRRISRFNQKQAKNLFTFGSKCVGRNFAENLIVILCGFLFYNIDFKVIDDNNNELNQNFDIPYIGIIGSFSIPAIDYNMDVKFKWKQSMNINNNLCNSLNDYTINKVNEEESNDDIAVYQSAVYGNNQLLLRQQKEIDKSNGTKDDNDGSIQ